VGVSADRYNISLGGSANSTRLNQLYRELVPAAEIAAVLDPLFIDFAREREPGETFGDYCLRAPIAKTASTEAVA
jgi:sulfite reductase beta subunit-like hemoprotein